jgi:hypothetical protein
MPEQGHEQQPRGRENPIVMGMASEKFEKLQINTQAFIRRLAKRYDAILDALGVENAKELQTLELAPEEFAEKYALLQDSLVLVKKFIDAFREDAPYKEVSLDVEKMSEGDRVTEIFHAQGEILIHFSIGHGRNQRITCLSSGEVLEGDAIDHHVSQSGKSIFVVTEDTGKTSLVVLRAGSFVMVGQLNYATNLELEGKEHVYVEGDVGSVRMLIDEQGHDYYAALRKEFPRVGRFWARVQKGELVMGFYNGDELIVDRAGKRTVFQSEPDAVCNQAPLFTKDGVYVSYYRLTKGGYSFVKTEDGRKMEARSSSVIQKVEETSEGVLLTSLTNQSVYEVVLHNNGVSEEVLKSPSRINKMIVHGEDVLAVVMDDQGKNVVINQEGLDIVTGALGIDLVNYGGALQVQYAGGQEENFQLITCDKEGNRIEKEKAVRVVKTFALEGEMYQCCVKDHGEDVGAFIVKQGEVLTPETPRFGGIDSHHGKLVHGRMVFMAESMEWKMQLIDHQGNVLHETEDKIVSFEAQGENEIIVYIRKRGGNNEETFFAQTITLF